MASEARNFTSRMRSVLSARSTRVKFSDSSRSMAPTCHPARELRAVLDSFKKSTSANVRYLAPVKSVLLDGIKTICLADSGYVSDQVRQDLIVRFINLFTNKYWPSY